MLVALIAVLAMVSSLGADSTAQVVVVKAILSLSDFPVDVVGLSGRLPSPVDQATGGGNPFEHTPRCGGVDSFDTATGEFFANVTDLVTAGRFPLVWARSYSSARIATSPLGRGWTSI